MYKKENHSLARINKDLSAQLGQWLLLNREIDPRIITLRIDELITSKDLSTCKVFVYHPDDVEAVVKKLNGYAHPIHRYLFNNLKIRRVPKIKFFACSQTSPVNDVLKALDEIDAA
mgnify:CR=1 FL=1